MVMTLANFDKPFIEEVRANACNNDTDDEVLDAILYMRSLVAGGEDVEDVLLDNGIDPGYAMDLVSPSEIPLDDVTAQQFAEYL